MKIVVDTSVWSLALRRKNAKKTIFLKLLEDLVKDGRVVLLGAIRQELLSGIKHQKQYELLKIKLRAFPDINISNHHYELAAQYYNICRNKGLQGSNTDFLICAVANDYNYTIFTTDKDFLGYKKQLPIKLYEY